MKRHAARPVTVTSLLIAVMALGCARVSGIRGVVQASPVCGEAPSGSHFPADEASINVRCKDGTSMTASSDEQGRFFVALDAPLHNECTIEVAKSGYRTRTYVLGVVCEWETTPEAPECSGASLIAQLIPDGAGAAKTEAP